MKRSRAQRVHSLDSVFCLNTGRYIGAVVYRMYLHQSDYLDVSKSSRSWADDICIAESLRDERCNEVHIPSQCLTGGFSGINPGMPKSICSAT